MSIPLVIGRYEVTFNHEPTVDELVRILSQLPKEATPQFEMVDLPGNPNQNGRTVGLRISAEAPMKPVSAMRLSPTLPLGSREY